MRGNFFWAQDPFRATVFLYSATYSMTHSVQQFCAYTHDAASLKLAFRLIKEHGFKFEAHIARTRFWVPTDHHLYSYIALRFKNIDSETNHALGI